MSGDDQTNILGISRTGEVCKVASPPPSSSSLIPLLLVPSLVFPNLPYPTLSFPFPSLLLFPHLLTTTWEVKLGSVPSPGFGAVLFHLVSDAEQSPPQSPIPTPVGITVPAYSFDCSLQVVLNITPHLALR